MRETGLETLLVDLGFSPDERRCVDIVVFDEGIDVLSQLLDGGEGRTLEGFSFEDREPNLHLIEPGGCSRLEVEMHVRMPLEPALILRFVGVEIVDDDVKCRLRIAGNNLVHKVEELDAAAAFLVSGHHLACSHFEGREQRRGSVARVVMAVPCECRPFGSFK